eukprot:1649829-Pyramimonas_sp.AAC.1
MGRRGEFAAAVAAGGDVSCIIEAAHGSCKYKCTSKCIASLPYNCSRYIRIADVAAQPSFTPRRGDEKR